MNIDLKLKTYEQLQNEVITLNTNSYLKDLKIEQLQSNWDKVKNYCKKDGDDYLYNVYKYMIALEENKDVSDYE